MSPNDHDYYRTRAEEHRSRAEAAEHPKAAQIHLDLAAKYDALAAEAAVTPSSGAGWGRVARA